MNVKTLVAVTVLAALSLSGCQEQPQQQAQTAPAAVEVEAITLSPQSIDLSTELVGRTVDFRQAEIRPQVSGILQARLFEEGQVVSKGDVLYRIDPAPYQAELASAKAALAKAQASVRNTRMKAERIKGLLGNKSVSQQDYDDAEATLLQAKADLAAAKAAVLSAEINLDYTQIRAPIDGQIGRSSVTEGALLTANQSAALSIIRQLDPIYVDMTRAASKLSSLRSAMHQGNLSQNPEVKLRLENNDWYALSGELKFSEVSVDPSTSMVTMRAVFPNPNGELLPGMFVRAQLATGQDDDALLVPQKAIVRTPKGEATVMVVSKEGTAQTRVVELGQEINQSWQVHSGLQAGDQVIVAGLQKVRPGSKVTVAKQGTGA
ncbi:RND efflux system, membrane fusion protein CmeA [Pseudoalteromonas sp. SW0106-04]|uniref:efflux RND transporter periplasmic adaptor subunit n=1 Tax=Pseudoalteromonas sp. SW0106-04 TaxID=1702169 RepID=UPI0006B60FF5|nr:efflux RND transporter periplasmic adaptor subunit [Pseudoalteromonas sp. SW0106-04]GAP76248.1 RND efflux system, membrane fusion protein CmeA [Pseudoalteromonas sp. SW0106-04]